MSDDVMAKIDGEIRRDTDVRSIARDFIEKLYFELAKFPAVATRNDQFLALAYAVRDRVLHRWVHSARTFLAGGHRTVIYLSAEYLIGPQLASNLQALGIESVTRTALASLGIDLDDLIEHEEEPGLGNGGLGRLAACLMDSMATLDLPAIGHGLRYEFGIFDQEIQDGWQVERTDRWLRHGHPWEVCRHGIEIPVGLGGHTEYVPDGRGGYRVRWHPARVVVGVPHDTPIPGFGTGNTNFLRLWRAMPVEEFDLDAFQVGEYWRAVDAKVRSENVTKVLYPNDQSPAGKELRLEQQAFFVSCAMQDCIRLLLQVAPIQDFARKFTVQLNDTHPALAIAELMRLLVDVHALPWEEAWGITTDAFAFTNHTLMPEALETWPTPLVARLLPRHLEIVEEINRRFLDQVRARFPGDEDRVRRMSIIGPSPEGPVRIVNLAAVASRRINGVAPIHSRLLRETVMADFASMYPDRFINVTNGVNPRRFLALANPALAHLIDNSVGDGWRRDPDRLVDLERFAQDAAFLERWRAVKRHNKEVLCDWLGRTHALLADPGALLDAQCKRIHEYKRQHLNLLHIIALIDRVRRGDEAGLVPRTFLFAGKAAPGYRTAKLIIRLAHGVAEVVEAEARLRRLMRVVFVPDFNVKTAQRIYPAVDLSEQISTAGFEASGTGNMKLMMNGALTLGTLDGANVDIREAVGDEHFFLFGLDAAAVAARRRREYRPRAEIERDPALAAAIGELAAGAFSRGDADMLAPLLRSLVESDPFLVLPDFSAYAAAQAQVAAAWRDPDRWTRSSIVNVARSGRFSSDRALRDYATTVWNVVPVPIAMADAPAAAAAKHHSPRSVSGTDPAASAGDAPSREPQ